MDLWLILSPILIFDAFNPVLLTFLVYIAASSLPVLNSSMALFGHMIVHFFGGIAAAVGIENITDFIHHEPKKVDFIIEFIVGVILIWLAFPKSYAIKNTPKRTLSSLTPIKSFWAGAILCFVGMPFYFTYLVAVTQILKADMSAFDSVVTLGIYNVLYALPFMLVPVLTYAKGETIRPALEHASQAIEKGYAVFIPYLLGLIGLALVVNASMWLAQGSAFF